MALRENVAIRKIIELKLWIFRILPGEIDFTVRVEGYRTKHFEEDLFITWRSSSIVERYNSHILFSSSGTKYVLCGVIDEESALSLGYPHALVRMFKDGFPPDWKVVLKQFIKENGIPHPFWLSEVVANSTVNQFSFNSELSKHSSFTEVELSETRQKIAVEAKSSMKVKKNAPKLQGCTAKRSLNFTSSNIEPNNMVVPEESENQRPLRQLCNWTFRFSVKDRGISKLFERFAIVLEGFLIDEDIDWKTSCVTEVKNSNHLCTALTEYELVGPMNTALALQQGFPKKFINSFKKGFPGNWHTLVDDFFRRFIAPEIDGLSISAVANSPLKARESNNFNKITAEERRPKKGISKRKRKWNVK
uniref:SANTA domain-containing protein n=1 Tax=Syphacia muris TaxID=451379 RepID=A0A158R4C8_9BILA